MNDRLRARGASRNPIARGGAQDQLFGGGADFPGRGHHGLGVFDHVSGLEAGDGRSFNHHVQGHAAQDAIAEAKVSCEEAAILGGLSGEVRIKWLGGVRWDGVARNIHGDVHSSM